MHPTLGGIHASTRSRKSTQLAVVRPACASVRLSAEYCLPEICAAQPGSPQIGARELFATTGLCLALTHHSDFLQRSVFVLHALVAGEALFSVTVRTALWVVPPAAQSGSPGPR